LEIEEEKEEIEKVIFNNDDKYKELIAKNY
jgi:hypothetical protein